MKLIYGISSVSNSQNTVFLNINDLKLPIAEVDSVELPVQIFGEIKNDTINNPKTSSLFKDYDYALWWYIYDVLFTPMSRTIHFVVKFEEMVNEKKPKIINLVGEYDKLNVIKQICHKNKIEIQYSKIQYFIFQTKSWIFSKIQKYRMQYIFQRKYDKRISLFKLKRANITSVENKIIFYIQTSYRRSSYDSEKKQYSRGEYIQGPIMNMLQKNNFNIVGIDVDISFKGDFQILSERLDDSIPWFPIEAIIEKYLPNHNYGEFNASYLNMIKSDIFKSFFNVNGINFWDMVKEDYEKLSYAPYIPNYIQMIFALQEFLKENRPRAVFIPNETAIMALAMIVACKKNKIKTIGIQHGLIHRFYPRYRHGDYQSENNSLGFPLPDFTLLFGNFTKKELEMDGYPKEKLIIFGNPVFFNKTEILKSIQSQKIKEKYNIPQNKKTILFATGRNQLYHMNNTYAVKDYDEQTLKKLLQLFANNDEYFVVLKPHPTGEYLGSYKKLISQYNATNFVIIQGDLFELLSTCDIMISFYSTSLFDAIALDKIPIRISSENYKITIPFDEYGALLSSDIDSLGDNIDKLLHDVIFQQQLRKNGIDFIKEQYNIPNDTAFETLKSILDA